MRASSSPVSPPTSWASPGGRCWPPSWRARPMPASWAGLCPGTHESAGKRRAVRTGKGNRWLRAALIEAALAAINVRDSALAGRYRRLVRHCGHKKAIVAVAHKLLTTAYMLLANGRSYHELGAGYYDAHRKDRLVRRALQTLAQQGYRVTLAPAA